MMSLQNAPRVRVDERFESDRESLPFPRGGVFGHTNPETDTESTQNGGSDRPAYAVRILRTIDEMQSSLDTLERELGAELEREFRQIEDVIGRIGATSTADDWPPAAA